MAYWLGRYVAVGVVQSTVDRFYAIQGAAWTSGNFQRWEQSLVTGPVDPDVMTELRILVPTSSALVAIGWAGTEYCPLPEDPRAHCYTPIAIWATTDGWTWWNVPAMPTFPRNAAIEKATASGTTIAALGHIGDRRTLWVSDDAGRTWDQARLPKADSPYSDVLDLAALPGGGWAMTGYVAPDARGLDCREDGHDRQKPIAWFSADARNWLVANMPNEPPGCYASYGLLPFKGGLFWGARVPFGALTSTDGRTWTYTSSPDLHAGMVVSASDGQRLLAVESPISSQGDALPYVCFVSDDGVHWQQLASLGSAPNQSAGIGGAWHLYSTGIGAVGLDNQVGTSAMWFADALTRP